MTVESAAASVILSQTAVYALKAALYLTERTADGPVRVDDIADQLNVPRNYLSKILHVLARDDILVSTRGPRGGFQLARSPTTITLSELLRHFGDLEGDSGCLLGREQCSDTNPCTAHASWKDVSSAVQGFFRDTSLADLSRKSIAPMAKDDR